MDRAALVTIESMCRVRHLFCPPTKFAGPDGLVCAGAEESICNAGALWALAQALTQSLKLEADAISFSICTDTAAPLRSLFEKCLHQRQGDIRPRRHSPMDMPELIPNYNGGKLRCKVKELKISHCLDRRTKC